MQKVALFLLVLPLLFCSCEKDPDATASIAEDAVPVSMLIAIDSLDKSEILGNWQLEMRSFGGITDMAIPCCEYLDFAADSNTQDFKGMFSNSGVGYDTKGVFELDPLNDSILFSFNNKTLVYAYSLSGTKLLFDYQDDGDEVSEVWFRIK